MRHAKSTLVGVVLIAVFLLALVSRAGEWYRGDLHSHSLHSDGDSPVADVLASVEAQGLDFFALTDHDSYMDGVMSHWTDPAYASDSVVLLYGVEWTSGLGHANAWAAAPFDYSGLWTANQALDPAAAVAAAQAQGALFSINHPMRLPWLYGYVDGVDCVEVWNGPMIVNNNFRAAHRFWDDALLQGRRLVGVGGSDTHQLNGWQTPFTNHGNPTTWVYAEARAAEAILAGIAAGHVTISYTVEAPRVEFTADTDGDGTYETMMGDNVAARGEPVGFRIQLVGGAAGDGETLELPAWLVANLNARRIGVWDFLWLFFMLPGMDDGNLQLIAVIENGDLSRAWLINGGTDTLTFDATPPAHRPAPRCHATACV